MPMIAGAHFLFYSTNAAADRAFLRDVLELRAVDSGGGWLIFTAPPSELAVHPAEGNAAQVDTSEKLLGAELYLMTRDINAAVASLQQKGVSCTPIQHLRWGSLSTFALPSGGRLGIYQPSHPTAISME